MGSEAHPGGAPPGGSGSSGDEAFLDEVAGRLAALPGIEAVSLGGSRALGTQRPGSDWDLGIYYRDAFDPQALRDIGWPGEVSGIGAWGGGVFNGGAWLRVGGRSVDVHYRDLAVIDHAREHHAPRGRLAECVGLIAQAACQAAHAALAARGEWPSNDKTLLERAGLRGLDPVIEAARPDPGALAAAVDAARALCARAAGLPG